MKIPARALLFAGVIGPLIFVVAFLIEGATRPGYSAWRNFVSQLATGDGGWMQTVNFLVCGTLMLCFAIGLRQSLESGRASIAAPILLGAFGLALITAGIFATDPALGYPVGAPVVHTTHGLVHGLAGLSAFTTLAAASFTMASRFGADPATRRWAIYSLCTGLLIFACFVASNVFSVLDAKHVLPDAPTGLVQRISIIGGWTWISLVALHLIRKDETKSPARQTAPAS